MRLTSISLTNFRSFKETQTIELAPVTLLFGPNSVGKSSVIMALSYVQQILEKGHCDPQKLDALGDKLVGGFRSLVYGGDLRRAIKIRLGFELGDDFYGSDEDDFAYLADLFGVDRFVELPDFGGSVETFAIEIEVAWSGLRECAWVRHYRCWVNDCFVGQIESSDDLKHTRVTELNLLHPLAMRGEEQEEPLSHFKVGPLFDEDDPLNLIFDEAELEKQRHAAPVPVMLGLERAVRVLSAGEFKSAEVTENNGHGDRYLNRTPPIGVKCQWGAIPKPGAHIETNLKYSELETDKYHLHFLILRNYLTHAFLEPIRLAKAFLAKTASIGPLRVVPDFDYVADPNPEQSSWADGRAAWDLLYRNPGSSDLAKTLLARCNHWLSDPERLNTGYELKNWSMFERLDGAEQYENSHYLTLKRHLVFVENGSGVALSAGQLGTGISQVLPVIAAANYEQLNLVSVEQPELHLHPRLQVELGDLLIECSKERGFLIETHSEHLILRMLRRIREGIGHAVDGISVIYLSRESEGGVKAVRQMITEDGDFEHNWPDGFFDERDEELF
jgi:hypothetical protein